MKDHGCLPVNSEAVSLSLTMRRLKIAGLVRVGAPMSTKRISRLWRCRARARRLRASPLWRRMRASLDAPYRLSSGDRLRVIVFGQDNLTNSFSVDGAGNLAMPLIGLGARPRPDDRRIRAIVEARLRSGYLREPKVSVEVEAFRPFFVLGEVRVGTIPICQWHDGADGDRHRRRLLAARRPERRRPHPRRSTDGRRRPTCR